MSGSIDVDVPAEILTEPAVPTAVYRYDGVARLDLLPNIQCEQIEFQVGPRPATARFRYILDHSIAAAETDWPTQFEEVWPVTAYGPYVVQADDRIVVCAWTPEGQRLYLFDGFAQIPQANITAQSQAVTFTAVGVEARCFDDVIGGRRQRDGDSLTEPDRGRELDLPARFNPSDGRGGLRPNCTPAGYDWNDFDEKARYPIFTDEHLADDAIRFWTTAEACCYILGTANDQRFVRNPPFDNLRTKVVTKRPNDDTFDPDAPASYTAEQLPLRDLDVSNKTWPAVLESLLSQVGLGFYFQIDQDASGFPVTRVMIERRDGIGLYPKSLRLDAHRSAIDPRRSNLAALAMSRDVNQVVNAWTVETPPRRYEVSVVLAPGFTPAAADASGTARNTYLKSRLADATAEVRRKYRWYIADECGEGHWDGSSLVTTPFDFSGIFPDEDGSRTYCRRYRPGEGKLITEDAQGTPRKATLHYSQDYVGGGGGPGINAPALWDGSGNWTEIGGGWKLLEDRLGIEVTADDPENWSTGKNKPDLKGITWQANPPANKRFWLLLTTVIEDDFGLGAVIGPRLASPTQYARWRRIDARDHYKKEIVSAWSWYNQADAEIVARDDTEKAEDLARQYRAAHEMAPFAGTATLPFITRQYGLFDRIRSITGRDVSLRSNLAADQGEGPRYPYVVKVSWQFAGDRQSTTIHLSDLRGEAPRA